MYPKQNKKTTKSLQLRTTALTSKMNDKSLYPFLTLNILSNAN